MQGWIKLHRRLLDWRWIKNPNVLSVFIQLLLRVNFEKGYFESIEISRGSLVTSLETLANSTNLSLQQVRTALSKLKSTGEITTESTNKFTVITIVKFDTYQDEYTENNKQINKQSNNQITNEQQTNNKQITTIKEEQEFKNERMKEFNLNYMPVAENFEKSKYYFEGKIIKLNSKDFLDWEKAYPELNLYAELMMYDKWLSENSPDEKKWFPRASRYLLSQNELRKEQRIKTSKETAEEEFYL